MPLISDMSLSLTQEEDGASEESSGPIIAMLLASIVNASIALTPSLFPQPHHDSLYTGRDWIHDMQHGHPDRIFIAFGLRLHVFTKLLDVLRRIGLGDSRHIGLEEQLGLFLYTCVTGLTSRHVAERFQRSHTTVSK